MSRVWKKLKHSRGLLAIVVGLLAAECGAWAFTSTWQRYSPDEYTARIQDARRQHAELLVVGGSPVSEGISPEHFGPQVWAGRPLANAYTLGLSGATTSEVYHAVARVCESYSPKVIVYGMTASDFNDARQEPHGPASLMTARDVITWARTRPDSRSWVLRKYSAEKLSRVSSIWQHRHAMRMWGACQLAEVSPGSCPESVREAAELQKHFAHLHAHNGYAPAAGFVGRRYDFSKARREEFPPFTFLNNYRIGSHLTYLVRLVELCRSKGIDLILVDMPVTADLENENAMAFQLYREAIDRIAARHELLRIDAHRERVGLSDADFADTIHLNGPGAMRLSVWLGERLRELGREPNPDDRTPLARASGESP